MKKEYLRIEKLILQADFAKAEKLIKKIDIKDWSGFLSGVAQESGSINPYGFIGYLLQKKEIGIYHFIATLVLSQGLVHLPYVFELALFHQRKAIELDPKEIGYQEYLLYFNEIPERVLSDKEALNIAREILQVDSKNEVALRTLKRINI